MFTSMTSSYGLTYGLVLSLITAILTNRCNYLFRDFPSLYPTNLRQTDDKYRHWKWRNFLISFVHSLITGIGSLLCVLYKPRLLIEVIDEYLEAAYLLTSFSHGYFIYDLIEMITHLQYKGSKELVVHHILILCCFSLTVTQNKYCGYSSIALLIELSNIFLHFRQLMILSDKPKSSTVYKINSYINIILFVLVRGLCLFWLWLTLIWVLSRVPIIPKIIAFTTLIGICLMTCILFIRIYKSDFTIRKSRQTIDQPLNGNQTNRQTDVYQTSDFGKQSNGLVVNTKTDSMHSKTN